MTILAIDTSCDETSVAIVGNRKVLSNVISSQVRYHKKYGGVVPFLAQRLHKERIDSVVELALARAGVSMTDIEAIAVTYGPGLAPALQVGIATAVQLATQLGLPFYPINHMLGHLAAPYVRIGNKKPAHELRPSLGLLVSGGHTEMVLFDSFEEFAVIGQTVDDAVGEAYDKVAKMLGLGYPGGRLVARLAREGNPSSYELPVPMLHSGDLNFSYSGLKNAVRLLIEKVKGGTYAHPLTRQVICDICATFELVAQRGLTVKVEKALQLYPDVEALVLAGGVAANTELRKRMRAIAHTRGLELHLPPNLSLCTDNAAMIGVAAYLGMEAGLQPTNPEIVDRVPNLKTSVTSFTKA
jgi:N6-L-threonylcarbamoyladenine synthase